MAWRRSKAQPCGGKTLPSSIARTHEIAAIDDEAAFGGVEQIDHVVHGAAEFVHVLAVEGVMKVLLSVRKSGGLFRHPGCSIGRHSLACSGNASVSPTCW